MISTPGRVPRRIDHLTGIPDHVLELADAALERGRVFGRHWRASTPEWRWMMIWRIVTAPFWVGSELPSPSRPRWRSAAPATNRILPAAAWLNDRLGHLQRGYARAWVFGSAIRGVSLGLALVLLWIVAAILGDWALPSQSVIVGVPLMGMVIGAVFGWSVRPDADRIVRMLDWTFRLDERLSTAVDTLRTADPADDQTYVSRIQMADAANALHLLGEDVPRPWIATFRELWFLALLLVALLTGLFAWVPDAGLPQVRQHSVPVFVSASERLTAQQELPTLQQSVNPGEPTVSEVGGSESGTAQSDLDILGEGLQQNPTTSQAGDAIAEGDYAGASGTLRDVADNAGSLPQDERDAIADELDRSADQMSGDNPSLVEATRKAANDLRGGGPKAGEGLNDVAEEVERTGNQADQSGSVTERGESQAGDQGDQQSGQQQQQQQGQQASDGSGAGAQTDPGEGVSAESGVVDEGQPGSANGEQGGQAQGDAEGAQGGTQAGAGSAPEEAGSGEPGAGTGAQSGDPAGGGAADAESGGGQQPSTDQASETSGRGESSQGSGAGSGPTNPNQDAETADGQNNGQPPTTSQPQPTEVPGNGKAVDDPPSGPNPGNADGSGGTVQNNGDQSLPLQGGSDENVQSGNDSGSSSTGSGSSSGTASGEGTQGSVGVAGPDSNVVPEDMRETVGDYFDGTGEQP